MRLKNIALAAVMALALPLGVAAQEETAPQQGRRRIVSEAEAGQMRERIHERFMDMAAERLELDANQRTRLATVLEQNGEQRRAIAQEGMRLRREAADVLAADSPDRARAESILAELTRLRERELQLWRTEQDALADVLTPTQRLELMAMQARFDNRVRHMRQERGPGGHGGARGERGHGGRRAPEGGAGAGERAPLGAPRQ